MANTPTQMALDDLKLPVSDERFNRAMVLAARYMGGKYDLHEGIIRLPYGVQNQPGPFRLQVLYRKMPCGFISNKRDGTPCVSFDVIPLGIRGDPRRSKIYKSFPTTLKNSKIQFGKFLGWLRIIADAVRRYSSESLPVHRYGSKSRPVYIGVFLTPQSRNQLLRDFPPVHENIHADYLTLIFKPTTQALDHITERIGSPVNLKVVGYAQDDHGSALMVDLPMDLGTFSNRTPHITISTSPGIKPEYSNKLLANPDHLTRVPPKIYEGILDTFPRSRKIAALWLQRQADLTPPLGHPGGTCHVVQRIIDEVDNPRLESKLVKEVQRGNDLPLPATRTIYAPEKERGAWKYRLLLTPHAQYRMDLRGISVPEIRAALDNFFRVMNEERSQGDTTKWDRFNRGIKIEWYDPRTDTFFVFTGGSREVTVVTTYKPGES